MVILAGVAVFSNDLTLYLHDKTSKKRKNKQTLNIYNLVQITIRPECTSRGLGLIAMLAQEEILSDKGCDFVFWCGCAKGFYELAGSKVDPVMIKTPFKIDQTDALDRQLFFYMDIKQGGVSKFQRNIVSVYEESKGDITFSIGYNNGTLVGYYGLKNMDEDKENFDIQPLKNHNDMIILNPDYEIMVVDQENVNITISIEGKYDVANLRYHLSSKRDYIVVSGTGKADGTDGQTGHKFEMNIQIETIVSPNDVVGKYDELSKAVIITAKTKIKNVLYSH